jgi:hypothetical protein
MKTQKKEYNKEIKEYNNIVKTIMNEEKGLEDYETKISKWDKLKKKSVLSSSIKMYLNDKVSYDKKDTMENKKNSLLYSSLGINSITLKIIKVNHFLILILEFLF